MAYRYRAVDRDQPFLLPPDLRDWLPAGHLAFFVIDAVDALDVSRLRARPTPAGSAAGRAAYDPRMLLALLVYGYARGLRSSRKIERACTEDVAFRLICAQDPPDHATIARFRRQHFADPLAMGDLFGQVLAVAAAAGLGRLGLVAVDGTKIAASASKDANRTEQKLRELAGQILAEAEEADAAEDALFGDGRGGELPAELADPVTRRQRIAAALARLEAERTAVAAERDRQAERYLEQAAAAGRRPAGGRPAGADVTAAQLEVDRLTAAQQARIDDWERRDAENRAAGGGGLRNPPRRPAAAHVRVRQAAAKLEKATARAAEAKRKAAGREAGKGPGPVANITDPHSHLMPVRGGGFIQGYNAQAAHSADGLCLGGLVTGQTTDFGCFGPLLDQIAAASDLLRRHARGPLHRLKARPGTVLADAGYLSHANLTCAGPDRLIATGARRVLRSAAAGQADGSRRSDGRALGDAAAAMATRLASPQGQVRYRQRGPIAETPFGNAKHNLNFRRFSMRGLARVSGEWAFQNTTANLLKIYATGWQPA